MSFSLFVCGALCLLSGIVSILIYRWTAGRRVGGSSDESGSQEDGEGRPRTQLMQLVQAVDRLASQMSLQVGEHSGRVTEITDSISSKEVESALVIYAGNLLIEANRKLKVDLDVARTELGIQRRLLSQTMVQSLTDSLTSIANRRAWEGELDRVAAASKSFCILMIDIDHFKRINDVHGHMVGDQILKVFSRSLLDVFRENDFIARVGGEEFAVLMPSTSLGDATRTAEKARQFVEGCPYTAGNLTLKISISVGIKQAEAGLTPVDMMAQADEALYAAKTNGRNRCYLHTAGGCCPIEVD